MNQVNQLHHDEEDEILDESALSDNSDWETIFSDDSYDELDYEDEYEDDSRPLDDTRFTYAHSNEPASSAKTVTHTIHSEPSTNDELRIEAWLVDSSPAPMPLEVELDFGDMPFEDDEEAIRPVVTFMEHKIDRHTMTRNLKKLLQRRYLRRVSDMDALDEPSEGAVEEQDIAR
jgi:hypothetical protein